MCQAASAEVVLFRNGVDSYACIIGSEGALLMRIAWSHDNIQDVVAAPRLPEFRFARALDGTFINYDLRNRAAVRLRFGDDLTIEGPAGMFRVCAPRSGARCDRVTR